MHGGAAIEGRAAGEHSGSAATPHERSPQQVARVAALIEAIAHLERSHKRLMQDTCYAGDSVRLI